MDGAQIERLEIVLLQHPLVEEARVLQKIDRDYTCQIVAYVVLQNYLSPQALREELDSCLPARTSVCHYVPLTILPRDAGGRCDDSVLKAIPVVTSEMIGKLEGSLRGDARVEQASVVVSARQPDNPPWHLADVLPVGDQLFGKSAIKFQRVDDRNQSSPDASVCPSEVSGDLLQCASDQPSTLPQALARAVRQSPDKGIVYIDSVRDEDFQPYAELLEDAWRLLTGLKEHRLKPGDIVILQLEHNRDFLTAFWACMLGGFVPVPIEVALDYTEKTSSVSRLYHAWELLHRPMILTNQSLLTAIRTVETLWNVEGMQIANIEDCWSSEPDTDWHECNPEDLALLMLTSGSTGVPKAVKLTHANILSMVAGFAQMNGFSAEDVSLNWMPLDHVGAIVSLHSLSIYLACQQVNIPREIVLQDVSCWLDLIEKHDVTISWAPNFAFKLVVDRLENVGQQKWDLGSMRFLINAGEMIITRTARQFLQLLQSYGLPPNAIRPAFGMSEMGSGITYSDDFSLDSTSDEMDFVDLGPPIPGAHLRIVDEKNQLVPEGVNGHLQVQGPSVMAGYYENPEANISAFTADGWFETGDLGFLMNGRLTLTGRGKDAIIIRGLNYESHAIEAVVEEVDGVVGSYTAACAVQHSNVDGEKLVIFFHPLRSDDFFLKDLLQRIRSHVIAIISIDPNFLVPVQQDDIPKTGIGKIQRSQLRRRFEAGEFDAMLKRVDLLLKNENTLPGWFFEEVWRPREIEDCVVRLRQSSWLIFSDNEGLGKDIANKLLKIGCQSVIVTAGPDFMQVAKDSFVIDPAQGVHYERLFALLKTEEYQFEHILHGWTYTLQPDGIQDLEALQESQQSGVLSLLRIVQAAEGFRTGPQSITLTVVSSRARSIAGEPMGDCSTAPIVGFLHTLPNDLDWMDYRHIDLEAASLEVDTACLWRELSSSINTTEVSYRRGHRFIFWLQQLESTYSSGNLQIQKGGLYLMTGGLGGIGFELARLLIETYHVKLMIVGRTDLSEPSDDQIYQSRSKAYESLLALDGDMLYRVADVCDPVRMDGVLSEAEQYWNRPLAGILHLAGVFSGERKITEETPESFAAVLRPVVDGAWNLGQLLEARPEATFVGFSATSWLLGHPGRMAYAAANGFLQGFCQHLRNRGIRGSQCITWSMWENVGLSEGIDREVHEMMAGLGEHVLSTNDALNSFLISLRCGHPGVIVGLNAASLPMRKRILPQHYEAAEIVAYVVGDSTSANSEVGKLTDTFGHSVSCTILPVDLLPVGEDGAVDRNVLAARMWPPDDSNLDALPSSDMENEIWATVQKALNIPGSTRYRFDQPLSSLGLDSLSALELKMQLEMETCAEVSIAALLRGDSLSQIAATIATQLQTAAVNDADDIHRTG